MIPLPFPRMGAFTKIRLLVSSLLLMTGTVALGVVAAPTLNPTEGDSLVKFNVALNCATSGAQIHYTLNGVEPSASDPWVASGGSVLIDRDLTLKAKAFTSSESSATTTANYLVSGDVSAGASHVLSLSSLGKVKGFGQRQYGRLADGTSASGAASSPAAARYSSSSDILDAAMVAGGFSHSLILSKTGEVYGVGRNNTKAVGDNTTTDRLYPVHVLTSTATTAYLGSCIAVEAAEGFSLALGANGKVYAWGSQDYGQLGDNASSGSRGYAQPVTTDATGNPDLTGIVAISSNRFSSLAREANSLEQSGASGRVWGWGRNNLKQVGYGSGDNTRRASLVMLNSSTVLTDAWDVASGGKHAAIVRWKTGDSTLQGSVWCVGNQQYGRLGNNQTADASVSYPVQVQKSDGTPLNKITAVSANENHTLALELLSEGGKVWAWGYNAYGAIGNNSTSNAARAVNVLTANPAGGTMPLTNIIRVSAGGADTDNFSVAIAQDGSVYTWGRNDAGQLGQGTTTTSLVAKKIVGLDVKPTPPEVELAASLPSLNKPGATVVLTSYPSDYDGIADIVKVEFYNGSTLLGQSTSAPWTYNYTSLAAGNYSVKAIVTDTAEATGQSAVIPFTILPLTAPTVGLTATVTAATSPGAVTLAATPADDNGAADLQKVEFFNGATKLGEALSAPWQLVRSDLVVGNYSVTAKVTDQGGLSGVSAAQTFTIQPTFSAPTVTLASVMPALNVPGATVSLNATPADADGMADVSKVEFYNNNVLIGQVTASPWSFNYSALPAGNYSVQAKVTDLGGLTGLSSTLSFTILPYTAPAVTLAANVTTAAAPGAATLTATPTDANGAADVVKVEFFEGTTKLGEATTAPWSFSVQNIAAGSHTVHAVVTDQQGMTGQSAGQTFVISPLPVAPTVSLATVMPSINAPGSTVALNATPADANGAADLSKVEFYDNNVLIGQLTAAPWSFSYSSLPVGNHSVQAKVTDIGGLTGLSSTLSFTILPYTAPAVTLAANVTTAAAPGAATLTATPTDANGPSDIVKVEFYNGTTKLGEVFSSPWIFLYPNLPQAAYSVTAKVYDQGGLTAQSTAVSFSISNLVPDDDGMDDVWEIANGFDPGSGADAGGDRDGDGLTNLQEYQLGTDPNHADTDGDGVGDLADANPNVAAVVNGAATALVVWTTLK